MAKKFRDEIKSPKRIVVKIGSSCLTKDDGGLDRYKFSQITGDLIKLQKMGLEIVVISSGAIQVGRAYLQKMGKGIEQLQALSAIGQPKLIESYVHAFGKKKIHCGQVLLTHDDLKNRTRYFNARNTIEVLLKNETIPILNENDSVSFEEIAFGDNDQLAAMVAEMVGAELVVILSDSDGVYLDYSKQGLGPVPIISIDYKFSQISFGKKSLAGRGGMPGKIKAVRKMTPLGIPCIIASFKHKSPIMRALTKSVGTYFEAMKRSSKERRKGWIITTERSKAVIRVDDGAKNAILKGASVLPSGIVGIYGTFKRGDSVAIKHHSKKIATGICEYSSKEIEKIKGVSSDKIISILGFCPAKVVIHRNNLVVRS
ncbi:MAG: glutamate 5-kinase [Bacteriovoracaceae bacterium]|nr:glutamate 5-kinase [Bacteriovoracaceae bacterium]